MLLFKVAYMLPPYLVIPQETNTLKYCIYTASTCLICCLNELNGAIVWYYDKETQQGRGLSVLTDGPRKLSVNLPILEATCTRVFLSSMERSEWRQQVEHRVILTPAKWLRASSPQLTAVFQFYPAESYCKHELWGDTSFATSLIQEKKTSFFLFSAISCHA